MFLHYLKIAWRNLLKYKTQSVVSILGLAIGFTAFSFTMSWISYERGYDKHIKDADRIFKVLKVNDKNESGVQFKVPDPLKMYLENLPEVEAVTAIERFKGGFSERINNAHILVADTSFFKVFYPDIHINYPVELPESHPEYIILSENAARMGGLTRENTGQSEFFGESKYTLLDIVPGLPDKRTNIPFDVMFIDSREPDRKCPWCYYSRTMYLRIHENVNEETLSAKIDSIYIEESMQGVMSYILVPLRKAHYTYPEDTARIKFNHLKIFVIVSALVILCALFNYLMLFINKIKLRSRELALRKVNGASNRRLLLFLLIEIGFVLLLSLFIGGVLTELLYPSFVKLSEIEASKLFFFNEMIMYGIAIFCISLLGVLFPIYYFMGKNISEIIQPEVELSGGIKNSFTKVSLFMQLVVGVLLIFCTFVFLYQYSRLNSKDIGFDRFHINTFSSYKSFTKNEILRIAGVEKVIYFDEQFLPRIGRASSTHETETGEKVASSSV